MLLRSLRRTRANGFAYSTCGNCTCKTNHEPPIDVPLTGPVTPPTTNNTARPVCFNLKPVASAIHDEKAWKGLFTQFQQSLLNNGCNLNTKGVNVFWAATGGTEKLMLEQLQLSPQPAIIVAHPSQNSLPSALETLARIQQQGQPGTIVYVQGPGDKAGIEKLKKAVRMVNTRIALGKAIVGVIGEPSDWLVASCPEPVWSTWGPTVLSLPLSQALAQIKDDKKNYDNQVSSMLTTATEIKEAKQDDVKYAFRVKPALEKIIESFGLTACTVRCFDLVKLLGTSGCLALSDLNDLGVIAGCEGDIVSTIAMLWVREYLGLATWMANPSRVDFENNTLLLAHCTIPKTLTSSYKLRSHFESGLGVAIEGDVAMKEATLIRIGGNKLDKLWIAEADVLPSEYSNDLCRTQVTFKLRDQESLKSLLHTPLGNHVVVVPGSFKKDLLDYWNMFINTGVRE